MTETLQPHEIDSKAAKKLEVGDTFTLLTGSRTLTCKVVEQGEQ